METLTRLRAQTDLRCLQLRRQHGAHPDKMQLPHETKSMGTSQTNMAPRTCPMAKHKPRNNTRHRLHIAPKQKHRSDKPPYAKRKSSAPTPTNHPLQSCSPNMDAKVQTGHTREDP